MMGRARSTTKAIYGSERAFTNAVGSYRGQHDGVEPPDLTDLQYHILYSMQYSLQFQPKQGFLTLAQIRRGLINSDDLMDRPSGNVTKQNLAQPCRQLARDGFIDCAEGPPVSYLLNEQGHFALQQARKLAVGYRL